MRLILKWSSEMSLILKIRLLTYPEKNSDEAHFWKPWALFRVLFRIRQNSLQNALVLFLKYMGLFAEYWQPYWEYIGLFFELTGSFSNWQALFRVLFKRSNNSLQDALEFSPKYIGLFVTQGSFENTEGSLQHPHWYSYGALLRNWYSYRALFEVHAWTSNWALYEV